MSEEEILHSKLQKSIDRMQSNNDELSLLMQTLCQKLGDLIGYKHKEKSFYRILVHVKDKKYDAYDLIEQTEEYIKNKDKAG